MGVRTPLICGPVLRYADARSCVLWVELGSWNRVIAELKPAHLHLGSRVIEFEANPVQVGRHWYAWIWCRNLQPGTEYRYRLVLEDRGKHRRVVWPQQQIGTQAPHPSLRTPSEVEALGTRITFGSCRAGWPRNDESTMTADQWKLQPHTGWPKSRPKKGHDALAAYARQLKQTFGAADANFPSRMIFAGDQIYGDQISASIYDQAKKIQASLAAANSTAPPDFRLNDGGKGGQALSFEGFASLYREGWTADADVRWLLATVPSTMIFDDHEETDDWNILLKEAVEKQSPEVRDQFAAGLLAYWVYQGAGNLDPKTWSSDPRMRLLVERPGSGRHDRTAALLSLFRSYIEKSADIAWSYAIDAGPARIVMADTRMHRKLDGQRLLADDGEWARIKDLALSHAKRDLVLVIPGPAFLANMQHDLYSWVADKIENDPSLVDRISTAIRTAIVGSPVAALAGILGLAVAGPVGFSLGVGLAEAGLLVAGFLIEEIIESILDKQIDKFDLELWPAFPTSLNRLIDLIDVASGQGRRVTLLTGDVHFSFPVRGNLRNRPSSFPMLQLCVSGFRQRMDDEEEDGVRNIVSGRLFGYEWALDLLKAAGIFYVPDFAKAQRKRLDWFPLNDTGARVDPSKDAQWLTGENAVGELLFHAGSRSYNVRHTVHQPLSPPRLVTRFQARL